MTAACCMCETPVDAVTGLTITPRRMPDPRALQAPDNLIACRDREHRPHRSRGQRWRHDLPANAANSGNILTGTPTPERHIASTSRRRDLRIQISGSECSWSGQRSRAKLRGSSAARPASASARS
jgi:hypothetical protein